MTNKETRPSVVRAFFARQHTPTTFKNAMKNAVGNLVVMTVMLAAGGGISYFVLDTYMVFQTDKSLLSEAKTAEAAPMTKADRQEARLDRQVQRAMRWHTCSAQGYGKNAPLPTLAVVTQGTTVKVVSFDRGWEIHQDPTLGNLRAVCLN